MSRHQLVRMLPSRQRFHAFHPGADRRIVPGYVEAEFFRRVIHVGRERYVRDGRTLAQEIRGGAKPLVDDAEIICEAALEERFSAGISRRREIAQETVR